MLRKLYSVNCEASRLCLIVNQLASLAWLPLVHCTRCSLARWIDLNPSLTLTNTYKHREYYLQYLNVLGNQIPRIELVTECTCKNQSSARWAIFHNSFLNLEDVVTPQIKVGKGNQALNQAPIKNLERKNYLFAKLLYQLKTNIIQLHTQKWQNVQLLKGFTRACEMHLQASCFFYTLYMGGY